MNKLRKFQKYQKTWKIPPINFIIIKGVNSDTIFKFLRHFSKVLNDFKKVKGKKMGKKTQKFFAFDENRIIKIIEIRKRTLNNPLI